MSRTVEAKTELYACGFNGHGQLDPAIKSSTIDRLTKIASGSEDVRVHCALWSATVLEVDGKLIYSGYRETHLPCLTEVSLPSSLRSSRRFFGDVSGVLGCLDDNDELCTFDVNASPSPKFSKHKFPECFITHTKIKLIHIAIAGNDLVCAVGFKSLHERLILVYRDFSSLLEGSKPQDIFTHPYDIKQLKATALTFNLLDSEGKVYTFGDGRHPSLLGRTPSRKESAGTPHVVKSMLGHNIKNIYCGNEAVVVLTDRGQLFIWGYSFPTSNGSESNSKGLGYLISPRRNEESGVYQVEVPTTVTSSTLAVSDAAVGDGHLIIRTSDGDLWAYGSNQSAQLGFTEGSNETANRDWTRLQIQDAPAEKSLGLFAGPMSTFVTIQRVSEPTSKTADE